MQLDQITVARDATHHEFEGQPLYEARFTQVLKYHPPGLAAVADPSGSYHITTDGCSAYPARFNSSFGFYDGLAAVSDATGWFHITLEGVPAYRERYSWCGNFRGTGSRPGRRGALLPSRSARSATLRRKLPIRRRLSRWRGLRAPS